MPRYVAFLRAINVGGRGLVSMTDLRAAFEAAGCRHVRTYIASGNVLFESPARGTGSIVQKVRRKLRTLIGQEPEILCLTAAEMTRVLTDAPFTGRETTSGAKLYVTFLAEKPRRTPALPLVSSKEALEVIGISGREAFVVSRLKKNGFFGFPNTFIEEQLGVPATSRNWSTVTKIVELARGA